MSNAFGPVLITVGEQTPLQRDMCDALHLAAVQGRDLPSMIEAASVVAQKHLDTERKACVKLLKSAADVAEEDSAPITPSELRNLAGTIESGHHLLLVRT